MTTRKIPKVPPLPSVPQNAGPRELEEHMLSLRATLSDILSDQNFHINKALLSGEAAVNTEDLADGSVTTVKVANLAVTTAKLDDAGVTPGKMEKWLAGNSGSAFPSSPTDGETFYRTDLNESYRYDANNDQWIAFDSLLDASRVGTAVIDTAAIVDAAIANAKIQDAAISTAKIQNLNVTNAKIADLAVDDAKINDLSADKINAGSLSASFIDIDGITLANNSGTLVISDGGVDTNQIADLAVEDAKINDLDAAKIQAGTIIADKFVTDQGVNLASIVPGELNFRDVDTALEDQADEISLTEATESSRFPSDPLDIDIASGGNHDVTIDASYQIRGNSGAGLVTAITRLYFRIDGGSWTLLVTDTSGTVTSGTTYQTHTINNFETHVPAGSIVEYAITVEIDTQGDTGGAMFDIQITITGEYFK